jgi:hypothetical protein
VGQHLHATEPRHFAQQQFQRLFLMNAPRIHPTGHVSRYLSRSARFHIIPKGQAIAEAGHEIDTSDVEPAQGLADPCASKPLSKP